MRSKNQRKSDGLTLMNWGAPEATAFQRQYSLLLGLLFVVLFLYALRLWHLQVLEGAKFKDQSENNRIRLEDIQSPRGIIFDRNGARLVENRPVYHLQLIREDVQDMAATIRELASLCGRAPEEFQSVVDTAGNVPKFVPIRLMADLDRDCLARIEAQRIRLPGVVIQLEPRREYHYNGAAAHLVGYLGEITEKELKSETYQGYYAGEGVGKVGVESAYEKYLHGKHGGRQVEVDATGRRRRLIDEVLPIPGRNVWLTIDIELQRIAEASLDGQVGAIVALDPNSGEVLALANSPGFDQEMFVKGLSKDEWNALTKDPRYPLLNRAIGAAYPPGSTYKPFIALAALKEGLVNPETSFGCPGYYSFGDRKYRCWRDSGHGSVDLERALGQSCDVYFYQSGMALGVDLIAQYATYFGLGEKSGIGLHGEHSGLVPTSWWKRQAIGSPWQKGETLSIAIGQGADLATPLQITLAYAAIANGGKLWQPYVVKRIEGGSSSEAENTKPKLKRQIPIDARYFQLVQKGLLGVVEGPNGTAKAIKDKSIPIAGKTGTAQVVKMAQGVDRKLLQKTVKYQEQDHAWFVGYAPANDPQIVVGALIEHGGSGSSAAAPLVQKVILSYLGDNESTEKIVRVSE